MTAAAADASARHAECRCRAVRRAATTTGVVVRDGKNVPAESRGAFTSDCCDNVINPRRATRLSRLSNSRLISTAENTLLKIVPHVVVSFFRVVIIRRLS